MDLSSYIRQLPRKPGVYFMKDSLGNIIYVGKSKDLRSRVSQYFRKSAGLSPQKLEMVRNIREISHITVDTELDAFLTECRYIKEYKPMYNKQLKNDGKYVYIKLNMANNYPGVSIVSSRNDGRALYFGPYTSLGRVENMVDFIKSFFPIRKCSGFNRASGLSACLNYSLGKCYGACRENADREEYAAHIETVVQFLNGSISWPVDILREKMDRASEELDFEKAALYRDQLKGLRHVLNRQRLINSSRKAKNIAAVEPVDENFFKLFLIKANKLLSSEVFSMDKLTSGEFSMRAEELFISYFAAPALENGLILTHEDVDQAQIIYSYLLGKRDRILCFWIPSNWLTDNRERLAAGIAGIVGKIKARLA